MTKVLFVSIAFPPKKDPECIQTGRLIKYLGRFEDLEIDVITAKPPVMNMPLDESLLKYDFGYNNKFEVVIFENRYLNFLKKHIKRFFPSFFFPDTKYAFRTSFFKNYELNDFENTDIIYSRSYPISSAFLAYELSLKLKKKWIAHFSDPWLLSPLHNYSSKEKELIGHWERKFVEHANVITLTSEKTIQRYKKHYPDFATKFSLITNVFDDDDLKFESNTILNEKIRIVYTGGIVGNRNPESLIKAIDLLQQSEKERFEFIFAGDADQQNRKLINQWTNDCTQYLGLVSLDKAMKLQESAHMLLLIDNRFDNAHDAIYLPSKLLDYLTRRKKIFAISTIGGTTDQILQSTESGYAFGHDQVGDMLIFLRKIIHEFDACNLSFFNSGADCLKFSASENAKKLYKIIKAHD